MTVAGRKLQKNRFNYKQHRAPFHPMKRGFFHAQPEAVPA